MQQLIQVLQKIRGLCGQHRGALQANEMLTRYCLIDPVLRALGWDTEDPDMVVPEFDTGSGRPDYVLRWNGQPYIAIEAKKLGKDLQEARKDNVKYCYDNKIPFFVVTDGDIWELQDMTKFGEPIFSVQITKSQYLGHTARQLLMLHRDAMPIQGAATASPAVTTTPLVTTVPVASPATTSPSPAPHTHAAAPNTTVSSPTSSLTTIRDSFAVLKRKGFPVTGTNPSQVIFPNSIAVSVKQWKDVLIKVIEELDRQGCLPSPPFMVGTRRKTILYSTDPDSVRKPYQEKPYSFPSKQYGTIYIKTHGSAEYITRSIHQLLQKASQNCGNLSPQNVYLEYS